MIKRLFSELGLSSECLRAVDRMGFELASPIQSGAIPALLEGRDVVGLSQTGSGKTAAYAIPAIEKIDPKDRRPYALVLCPTRELALQVAEEVAKLAFFKRGIREVPIYGGQAYDRQLRSLKLGAHIVIGTPGRVLDHLSRGTLDLSGTRYLVLDEADRMLDMGFIEDIEAILSRTPEDRQTALFSATFPRGVESLVRQVTRNPVDVRIEAQDVSPPDIDQVYYEVNRRDKLDILCRLIDLEDIRYGIIFCSTKLMVDELNEHLGARGYSADRLHGDMSQSLRERVIGRFRKRAIEFLVATDVAARGLDVQNVEAVINFDLPHDAEDYLHRIGRTGRAGRSGRAISFVAGREIYKMQPIIRFMKGRIRRERIPTADEVEAKRAHAFYDSLRDTLERGAFPRQDNLIERLLDQGYTATDIASALIHLLDQGRPQDRSLPLVASSASPAESPAPRPPSEPSPSPQVDPRPLRTRGKTPAAADPSPSSLARDQAPPPKGSVPPPAEPKRAKPVKEKPAPPPTIPLPALAEGKKRIILNLGQEHGAVPEEVALLLAEAGRIPPPAVGPVHLAGRQGYADVPAGVAQRIIEKLLGQPHRGRRLWIALQE